LRDYSDSEDEGFLPNAVLPPIEEGSQEAVTMASQSTVGSGAPLLFGQNGPLRAPLGLPPIDTGNDGLSPRLLNSKSTRDRTTPTKRARTEEDVLGSMHIAARQACFSPQPPFNSGIPSIFAPHSLTPEVNPFFLQSALPSSNRLPSIRTLLNSELANPFSAYIPFAFHTELPHTRFAVPEEVRAHVRRSDMSGVDPAAGYGFSFGGPTTTEQPQEPAASGLPGVQGSVVSPADAALDRSLCISTPNIDRACQYLSQRYLNTEVVRCICVN
jgi:hypothetical protein